MNNQHIAQITVSSELYHVEPLQEYVAFLAKHWRVPKEKLFYLKILIEEVFTHIVSKAFNSEKNGEIEISIYVSPAEFELIFHYCGIPFGYSLNEATNEEDEISLTLIRLMSSSYALAEDGKNGQFISLAIEVESDFTESLKRQNKPETKPVLEPSPTDELDLREIQTDEMEALIQGMYQIYAYTYGKSAVYYPEAMRDLLRSGLYKGFVAVNKRKEIVAHAGLLMKMPNDSICECGQAFTLPAYGKRGLNGKLMKMLLQSAEERGLKGVLGCSVTGYAYSQKAFLNVGAAEVGLELSYLPADSFCIVERIGSHERQSVMNCFSCTSHQETLSVYVPQQHAAIVRRIYSRLGLERTILSTLEDVVMEEKSQINFTINTECGQAHISVEKVGRDFMKRMNVIIRQAIAGEAVVFYAALSMGRKDTPLLVNLFEKLGFFFAGIMPYEIDGSDSIRLQYIVSGRISPENVLTASHWGEEIKDYVFECRNKSNSL